MIFVLLALFSFDFRPGISPTIDRTDHDGKYSLIFFQYFGFLVGEDFPDFFYCVFVFGEKDISIVCKQLLGEHFRDLS